MEVSGQLKKVGSAQLAVEVSLQLAVGSVQMKKVGSVQLADKATGNCRPQTANCLLQTANCQLPTANCQLKTAYCKLSGIPQKGHRFIFFLCRFLLNV
jgi:hypothetical protein